MLPRLRSIPVCALALTLMPGAGSPAWGAGPLFVPPFASFATPGEPYSVAIVDLDGDARPDLVTANYGDLSASSLLGNGDGTFAAHTDYLTGDGPWTVTAGDLNGDGRPDIVLPAANSFWLSVLIGHGDGTFAAKHDFRADNGPRSVAIGDVNGDGKLDLVTVDY